MRPSLPSKSVRGGKSGSSNQLAFHFVARIELVHDERPLCARSGQSGMTLGEIMAHFLITSLEPPVIKAAREILLAAKVKSRSGELIVLKTYQSNRSIAIRRIDRARHRRRTSMRADVQRKRRVGRLIGQCLESSEGT